MARVDQNNDGRLRREAGLEFRLGVVFSVVAINLINREYEVSCLYFHFTEWSYLLDLVSRTTRPRQLPSGVYRENNCAMRRRLAMVVCCDTKMAEVPCKLLYVLRTGYKRVNPGSTVSVTF